jgi:hypothetical protein
MGEFAHVLRDIFSLFTYKMIFEGNRVSGSLLLKHVVLLFSRVLSNVGTLQMGAREWSCWPRSLT